MHISRNSLTMLVGAAASALILSACGGGGGSSSSSPVAQAALTVAAVSSTLSTGETTNLSTTGGSGNGAVTYEATGGCTVSGAVLTARSTAGSCSVTATKAADGTSYLVATSTNTVTITVVKNTLVGFSETRDAASMLIPFEGLSDTSGIATDPTETTNKVAKLVKVSSGQPWAGATVSTCDYPTNGTALIPFSASIKTMSMRVYGPASTTYRLKIEDGAGAAMEQDAVSSTTANTWQVLTFNFATPVGDGQTFDATKNWSKVSVFPAFLSAVTSDTTYYVDDIKVVGVENLSLTCRTAPVSVAPTVAATAPALNAGTVKALYSNTYTPVAVGAFPNQYSNPNTGGSDLVIGGNTARKLTDLNWAILEPSTTFDISSYGSIRFSVWTATGTVFKVKLVDFGANGVWNGGGDDVEHEITLTAPTQNQWTYYNIPISDFTGLTTKAHFAQIIFSTGGTVADFWIDDIYFAP